MFDCFIFLSFALFLLPGNVSYIGHFHGNANSSLGAIRMSKKCVKQYNDLVIALAGALPCNWHPNGSVGPIRHVWDKAFDFVTALLEMLHYQRKCVSMGLLYACSSHFCDGCYALTIENHIDDHELQTITNID